MKTLSPKVCCLRSGLSQKYILSFLVMLLSFASPKESNQRKGSRKKIQISPHLGGIEGGQILVPCQSFFPYSTCLLSFVVHFVCPSIKKRVRKDGESIRTRRVSALNEPWLRQTRANAREKAAWNATMS